MKSIRRRDPRLRSVEALARTNAARQEAADAFADEIFPIISELLKGGAKTKTGIAEALNELGISPPHGGSSAATERLADTLRRFPSDRGRHRR